MDQYKTFLDLYIKANPSMKKQLQYENAQKEWKELKKNPEGLVKRKLELKSKISKNDARNKSWWLNSCKKSTSDQKSTSDRPSEAFPETITSDITEKKVKIHYFNLKILI